MEKKKKTLTKILQYVLLVIILNIATIIVSISFYKYYTSGIEYERRRLIDSINSGDVEGENISEMVFEYEITLGMKNGEKRELSGTESYCWDGHKFFSASDFMKGYTKG